MGCMAKVFGGACRQRYVIFQLDVPDRAAAFGNRYIVCIPRKPYVANMVGGGMLKLRKCYNHLRITVCE